MLFSSIASIASTLGNPGQINYSAANGFVDGLAALRRRQGLPALCYNLAAVAEAGMAARNLHVLRMSRAGGVPPISADFAITNLDYAMRAMGGRDHRGHRPVLAPAVDRRLAGLPAHRPDA